MTEIEHAFPRGTCPIRLYGPLDDDAAPVVLVFMDAFGPRPGLDSIAQRIADEGYRVVLPNLFYENLPFPPLDAKSILTGGDDRVRMGQMLGKLAQAAVDEDVAALLSFVAQRFGSETPVAATGYCMGGRFALTAATSGGQVRYAASFHGATLAPEGNDGPHHRLSGVKASIYVGIAGIDPMFGAEEEGRLAQALRAADIDHVLETYAGAHHGFAMPDLPMHNAAASQRHWDRLLPGLRAAFGRD